MPGLSRAAAYGGDKRIRGVPGQGIRHSAVAQRQLSTARRFVKCVDSMFSRLREDFGSTRLLSYGETTVSFCNTPDRRDDISGARLAGGTGHDHAVGIQDERGGRTHDTEPAYEIEVVFGIQLDVTNPRHHGRHLAKHAAGRPAWCTERAGELEQRRRLTERLGDVAAADRFAH
jgi:hypothetical protein